MDRDRILVRRILAAVLFVVLGIAALDVSPLLGLLFLLAGVAWGLKSALAWRRAGISAPGSPGRA